MNNVYFRVIIDKRATIIFCFPSIWISSVFAFFRFSVLSTKWVIKKKLLKGRQRGRNDENNFFHLNIFYLKKLLLGFVTLSFRISNGTIWAVSHIWAQLEAFSSCQERGESYKLKSWFDENMKCCLN